MSAAESLGKRLARNADLYADAYFRCYRRLQGEGATRKEAHEAAHALGIMAAITADQEYEDPTDEPWRRSL